MPTNLNALIRYKTINSCLYGGKRRWSISELIEKCSDALVEYRGRYEPVSERTIRDDIRVMKSDILGYNAPITQQKGLYYYSDPEYSIMTISFTDSELIEKIISFLDEIRQEVTHPELEIILSSLTKLKNKYYWETKQKEKLRFSLESSELLKDSQAQEPIRQVLKPMKTKRSKKLFRTEEGIEHMASAMSDPLLREYRTCGDILISLFKFS